MRIFKTALAFGVFAAMAFAETFTGTLMDSMCKGKDPASHTRECAISCAKSGLGLVTADGKFVKFDPAGSKKALAALKSTKKVKDLKAVVTGTMQGEILKVDTFALD